MSDSYRYRQYRDGDAEQINHLYWLITGSTRTTRQFDWQWLESPAGAGDMWLIEAVQNDGSTRLIGHHGVMPIRFSRGDEDLLFGKTENTMLLPEYRSRILYPRFERRFAQRYEPRFDALFSTVGHAGAIRQRRAAGYDLSTKWVRFRIPTSTAAELKFIARMLFRRIGLGTSKGQREDPEPLSIDLATPVSGLRALDDRQASSDPFFKHFWSRSRSNYGLTPSRERQDLEWRFWSNPHVSYLTLVSDAGTGDPGYVVLRINKSAPEIAILEDIVPDKPYGTNFMQLLNASTAWMRANGIQWIDYVTTEDACVSGAIASGVVRKNSIIDCGSEWLRPRADECMPRKITSSGVARNVSIRDWYVTRIVFEGR